MWRALLVVFALGAMAVMLNRSSLPRGIRNHNPGNIRRSGDAWQGLAPVQADPAFFQFVDPVYGIRALVRILDNYQRKHGLRTVRQIINRWAPPVENDTGAYVAHAARALGVDPDASIDVRDHMAALVRVIIQHENGQQPYSGAQIAQGIERGLA